MLVPLLLVLSLAFFQRQAFLGIKWDFTLENYTRAWDSLYGSVALTSLWIAAAATVVSLLLGFPTAYAITRLSPKWRTTILILIVLPFWTNFLIRTYAWILLLNSEGLVNGALQALGLVAGPIEILYTPWAVILGMVYAYFPLMVLPLYAAIERLDPQLREAASNLGASRVRAMVDITLPLTMGGIVTGCLFVFVPSLGNFIIPELLGGGKTVMIGNLVRDQFLSARDWPFGATLATLLILFLIAIFVMQSWYTRRVAGEQ